ncbi:MAG: hypothetical protein A3G32_01080 [Deltaproteobacteria bacterium RIFCSPLOWO2_12_FULL_40_28]|nr:MAG: hypothetical protein A3C45_09965 [Deltaproteobacteria bacterium RIFCSPHIGHO2_02_FULL_40_28]OGQ19927.1 MAG: hypothetical protein A3E27_06915 [Deltaproteobacteria bacterium RIFCSPHIGHO2_12_FULL_40_32]OGQ39686.1 MAG: hypothetical protein A3I69_06345 [Deltaproteobacteria bacterium RIFCSPLOWO2_02_FULL_40_36]OGQ52942.1 MAG: hypothetical protein A3G32_01080 [Deltaproteobacteria bacterium RIFCSPLOWO2_12_FULL_40_28]
MAMKIYLTMPQPGETIIEGTLVRWLVLSGAGVKEGKPIVELETEKALFEYESPFEGVFIEALYQAGEVVAVGEPIAIFEVSDAKAKTYLMLGIGREVGKEEIKKEKIKKEAKKISQPTSSQENIVTCSPVRLRIADNMVLSKKTIPHAHTSVSVDVTRLVSYREQLKAKKEKVPSFVSLVFPSLKKAVAAHPLVNSSLRGKEIVLHQELNLGIAVGTEKGLFVPVVSHAHNLDLDAFDNTLKTLIQKAHDGNLTVDDLREATFTFNNFGSYGTDWGVQIVLPPQVSILGMGRILKRPWVVGDAIVPRFICDLSMAFDHRVMDGREAGLFLTDLRKSLENF